MHGESGGNLLAGAAFFVIPIRFMWLSATLTSQGDIASAETRLDHEKTSVMAVSA